MEASSSGNSTETNGLLRQLRAGDQAVWGTLLARHQGRLRRMIALRLDQRLRGRFDASDVLQEAYLRASVLLADYLRRPAMPFFLWLRLVTGQQLATLHRRHLTAQARDAGREVPLPWGVVPEASSAALAAQLLGREPLPCEAVIRAERRQRVEDALERLHPLDREVLALRHFEQLSNAEAAQVLGLRESAASKRYVRDLRRLKEVLTDMPGGLEEVWP